MIQVLQDAEARLRSLMEKAASEGDYDSVVEIAQAAGSLRSLASRNGEGAIAVAEQRSSISNPGKRKYPFFTRSGEELVKTGYSSTNKSDYQHRAPREVIDAFTRALEGLPKTAKSHFGMEDILPLNVGQRQIPDYQAYLVLAWFRDLGVVKKDGRVGYKVAAQKHFTQTIDAAWAALNSD